MMQPVIIDNGTGSIRAGYAGKQKPECQFSTLVARTKYVQPLGSSGGGDIEENFLIGEKAIQHRGVTKINYPITHGLVESEVGWEDMQKIWEFAYEELQVFNTEQHNILLTEPPNNPHPHRVKAAQIFFENFNVPGLYLQIQGVLSLYASAKTTGIVLDSGDGLTCAVPVYQGFALSHAVVRSHVAGRDITEYLQYLLQRGGYNFCSSAELEIVKSIKEELCYVSPDIVKSESQVDKESEISYELPDGQAIKIRAEKFRAPEILFDPSLIGEEYPGAHQALSTALNKTDMDIRNHLYSNILLAGGCTMFKGYGERLLQELQQISPNHTKIKIFAPAGRIISSWVGGSILGNYGEFKRMCVNRKEYDEQGPRAMYMMGRKRY